MKSRPFFSWRLFFWLCSKVRSTLCGDSWDSSCLWLFYSLRSVHTESSAKGLRIHRELSEQNGSGGQKIHIVSYVNFVKLIKSDGVGKAFPRKKPSKEGK